MNSQIAKVRGQVFDPATLSEKMSGNLLSQKLESWCQTTPGVLMWEVAFMQGSVRVFVDSAGKDSELAGNWRIEFQIVRARSAVSSSHFDGAFILAGYVKSSLELVGGVSQEAYHLSLNSVSVRGEQTFLTVPELWLTLTTLGMK
ncbi:MAG: hypothetical protein KBB55_01155 [Candidatus Buchananbacteria bacterium]|nr:hypothetical protein [Candidatus Buchananbacteria bacterium]